MSSASGLRWALQFASRSFLCSALQTRCSPGRGWRGPAVDQGPTSAAAGILRDRSSWVGCWRCRRRRGAISGHDGRPMRWDRSQSGWPRAGAP